MNEWTPVQCFLAQYCFAGAAAFFLQLCSASPVSIRQTIGRTGLYALIGGSFAPVGAALPLFPATLGKGERLMFGAIAIGAGLVSLPALRKIATKLLTSEDSDADGTR